ncbi:hypothetical protein LTS18_014112, partial [Coniosporium uncinatum]
LAVTTLLKEKAVVTDEEELLADIELLMRAALDEGWLEMEWFDNIPSGTGMEAEGEEVEGKEGDSVVPEAATPLRRTPRKKRRRAGLDDDDDDGDDGRLRQGLGTMFCDAINWLNEERRDDFREWKSDILERMARLEAAAG